MHYNPNWLPHYPHYTMHTGVRTQCIPTICVTICTTMCYYVHYYVFLLCATMCTTVYFYFVHSIRIHSLQCTPTSRCQPCTHRSVMPLIAISEKRVMHSEVVLWLHQLLWVAGKHTFLTAEYSDTLAGCYKYWIFCFNHWKYNNVIKVLYSEA